jgi:hypothetical protein
VFWWGLFASETGDGMGDPGEEVVEEEEEEGGECYYDDDDFCGTMIRKEKKNKKQKKKLGAGKRLTVCVEHSADRARDTGRRAADVEFEAVGRDQRHER